MRCPLKVLPLLLLALYVSSSGQKGKQVGPPAPPDSLSMPIFTPAAASSDSMKLQPGDSVFIYGGELYYRAHSGGKDFFVSQEALVTHADSLVIYQYYRLGSGAAQKSDSAVTKVERQRCTMITKDGTRCKRLAMPGSDRCWQHQRK